MAGVERASKFTHTYLIAAHPVSLTSKLLTIGFDAEFADRIGMVDNSKTHQILQTKLAELGHPHVQVKFVQAEMPAGFQRPVVAEPESSAPPFATVSAAASAAKKAEPTSAAAPAKSGAPVAAAAPAKPRTESISFSKDDFKNDPLIQKALEVFKGQIVEVRA